MLDANLKTQLKAYLEKVSQQFEIVASLDDSDKSRELLGLLQDIVGLTDKITLKTDGSDARKPSFSLNRPGADIGLRFAGIPMGHEFTSLVLALLQVGGHPSKLDADVIEQVKGIEGTFEFETYFSLSCQNCPDVVQALNLMAVLNPNIRHVAIDGALFQDEVEARQIMSVPSIYLNGEVFGQGRMGVEEILAKIDTGAAARDAEKLTARDAFDVLVVGGGPAGAAAAIYAARKGIRTGVAAERFGGQVLDTVYDVSDAEGLTQLNRLKTGMMISGAVELGCVAAKMNAGMRSQALTYADGIGRAFQIRDDMLDVMGDAAVFGKPIGSDREEGKVTFVDVLGLDGCAREVERCTEAAKSAVANWSDHMFLWELADRMVGRTK